MWFKLKLWLRNPSENLWLQPAIGAVFAIAFSLFATASRYFIPAESVPNISIETLSGLLDIISSSMLAVTTFSLSIMVAAFASAASSGTPRAYKLMMSDDNTRVAITSFISAFIYAVIAKIALGLEYYGAAGRFILFISTILVLIYLIYTLIRWIQTLSKLGSLGTTIEKIEKAASESLSLFRAEPCFGAAGDKPHQDPHFHYYSQQTGYLTNFDIAGLNELAESHHVHLHIIEVPGKFVDPAMPILAVYALDSAEQFEQEKFLSLIKQCVIIEANRNFIQDPRFGLLVMTEVGQKALSDAINDVGSAITTIHTLTRIIIDSVPTQSQRDEAQKYPFISIKMFNIEELISTSFGALARDCIDNIMLNQRLIKCLAMIERNVSEKELKFAALDTAKTILDRCIQHIEYAPDRELLIKEFNTYFPKYTK